MKHIKTFKQLTEGLESENVISMMTNIILERVNINTIQDNLSKGHKTKPTIEYSYKTYFSKYKDNEFIKKMLKFFDDENRTPKIIFRFEESFSYNYQTSKNEPNGFYNTTTSDIQINLYEFVSRYNMNEDERIMKQIKQTLSHELRHLYDDVVRNGKNSEYDNEDNIPYIDKPSEVRGRITGFINSYTGWDKPIGDIINDCVDAIKTDKYDRKKLLKLIYAIKNTGLKNHTVIPTKKLEGRKSDIDGFITEMNNYGLYNTYNKDHRVIDIARDILSINTIDEDSGELGYPLLDMLINIYENKNINITINKNNLELVDIIKNRYKKDIIKIRQKPNWDSRTDLKVKYLLSKSGKIPNYETIKGSDTNIDYDNLVVAFDKKYNTHTNDNLVDYCKELGLSESYMIKLLQTIIDKNKYIYLFEAFYEKYEHFLNLKNVDIHYFENEHDNKLYKLYIINAEKDKSIMFDRLKNQTNFKKIK